MSSIAEQKKELRAAMRQAGKHLDEARRRDAAAQVWAAVERLPEFMTAHTVALYWSLPDELFTHGFLHKWAGRKQILLPAICCEKLIFRRFDPAERLLPGTFGIAECSGGKVDPAEIEFVVVPGVAFDAANNRLGRGKGFYDTFLSAYPNLYKAGVCFDYQFVETVPAEAHDVKMDIVIFASR